MGKKLYEEESVRAIAEAIRNKGVSGSFKIGEMADAISSIPTGGGEGDIGIALTATKNGEYNPPDGFVYKPVNVDVPNVPYVRGWHSDDRGKFVYPTEEWGVEYEGVFYDNNIENIPIAEDEEVLYFLYEANQINSFCRIRIGNASTKVEYGLVKDGVFTPISSQTSVAAGGYYAMWLEDFMFDHVVIKVAASSTTQHITYAQTYAWASDGIHKALLPAANNSCLMRYGNMPYGTTITCICYQLEVDNVKNFAAKRTNTSLGLTYNSSYALHKLRMDGWNVANNYVTSLASAFNACYVLSDVPDPFDISGWCSSRTTSIASMFSSNYCLNTTLVVRDWVLSAVTTTASFLSNARSIYAIEGLETWTGGENITTIGSMFNATWSLRTPVNLSGLTLTNNLVTASSVFNTAYCLPEVILGDIDFSNVTATSSMFSYCSGLKRISHGTVIPCSSKMTTVNAIFAHCNSLSGTDLIKDWDLTNANVYGMFSYCTSMRDARDFYLHTIVPSTLVAGSTSSSSAVYHYCSNVEYVDYSMFDLSKDSASTKYSQTYAYNTLYNLQEVIPHQQFLDVAFTIASQRLNHDSLIRILNALPTTTTAGRKLTLGTINLSKLSNDEKAIATGKGWTLG